MISVVCPIGVILRAFFKHNGFPYYDAGYFLTDTIVSVETPAYSIPDSKLLWAGMSRTINPSRIQGFVEDLVSETVKKLKQAGMLKEEPGG